VIVTLLTYQPVWHGGLLWDDAAHMIGESLRSWSGLVALWTDPSLTQQYYPVTTSVFWALARVWGEDPFPYHLTSILLHGGVAVLLMQVLTRLRVPGAALAALIFAVHPVHVESVAWISEIKNTLSGVWYLLAVWWYLAFDDSRDRRWYAAAGVAFVLALGSKTVTATWPAAMLVLLWWRRGTLNWRTDVRPLLPWFVVGVTAGLTTAWLEYHHVGAQGEAFALSWLERGLLAGRVVWFYAVSLVWPHQLLFSYPRWTIDAAVWWQYLPALGALLVLATLWRLRTVSRGPLAAAVLFVGTLFPALGFINVFPFRFSYVADHFQYHASLALIAALAAGITIALRRWAPRVASWMVMLAIGVPLAVLASAQSRLYVDAPTLYRHTLTHNPTSLLALTNMASLILDGSAEGTLFEATALTERAVRHHPDSAVAHNLLGLSRLQAGMAESALALFDTAISVDPLLADAHYNRALALDSLGRLEEAQRSYEQAVVLRPAYPAALHNLATVLRRLGRPADALTRVEAALALDPHAPELHFNLGDTRFALGDRTGAITAYRAALASRPQWGEAWNNLGVVLRQEGRHAEAVEAFRSAVLWVPEVPMVHLSLAGALEDAGRPGEALAVLEAAYTRLPDVPQITAALHEARRRSRER